MTSAFKKELNGLDGKRISRELDGTSKSVDTLGMSARKSGAEINQLSGRLRLASDAVRALGPIVVPLAAA